MKINWNRKYTTVAVYTLIVIVLAVLFVVFVFRFEEFKKVLSNFSGVLAPAICGLVIAFILNPLMMYIENKFFHKLKYGEPKEHNIVVRKLRGSSMGDSAVVKTLEKHDAPLEKKKRQRVTMARVFSMLITFVLVFAALVGIIIAVVPSLVKSIMDLAEKMPEYLERVQTWGNQVFEDNPQIAQVISDEITDFADLINEIAEQIKPMAGDIIGNVSGWVMNFVGVLLTGVKNFIIGVIIAIYLLYSKEHMLAQGRKIIIAFFKERGCRSLFNGLAKTNEIFKKYIISNLLDSMIIFVFMLIGLFAMGMPYQTLIAVVCGVTNLIPFFGPFIGAVPSALLILLVDPVKVIWFAIFVLVIQQVDGNVIKPFLFGESVGLPAIWVLVSITVGGGLFGIVGMLLGVPVFAVFYALFSEFVVAKLRKKSLPGETEAYVSTYDEFSEAHFTKSEQPDNRQNDRKNTYAQNQAASVEKSEKPSQNYNSAQSSKTTNQKPNPKPQGRQNNRKK